MHIYHKNWLKVISCQEKIVRRLLFVIHHESIHELAPLRFIKLNLEYQNIKMRRRTYQHIFFSFMRLYSYSASCNRIPQCFYSCTHFFKSSYQNSYTWTKKITLALSKVIPFGMCSCNFDAIKYVLNKRKKLEMEYGPFINTILINLILCIRFRKDLVMLRLC